MSDEKGLFGGMGEADDEDGGSLFSAFKPAPRPKPANLPPLPAAPRPAPAPQPAQQQAVPPPPPQGPRPPAPPDMSVFLQQRVNDLEKRLLETQEKALTFSLELKNREELQRRSVNQAEELFEKLNQNQKNAAQEQKMRDRLEQLENICRRLEAGTAGPAAGEIGTIKSSLETLNAKVAALGISALEINQLKESVDRLNLKIGAVGALSAEIGPMKNALEAINSRMAAVGAASAEFGPLKAAVEGLNGRLYAFESRITGLESQYNELGVKGQLAQQMAAREDALTRERVERVERNSVPMEYLDRRLNGFEMDSLAIRKIEGMTDSIARRLGKVEGTSEALLAEQAKVNEIVARESGVLEELRAKFTNMSVIFEHIRKLIIK